MKRSSSRDKDTTRERERMTSINDLPQHMVIDILSRLPTKSIIHCRCVCRTWRALLSQPHFANLHLSRSPTSLIIHEMALMDIIQLAEFHDDQDEHHHYPNLLRCDPVMKFDLKRACYPNTEVLLVGSVNGFLCLCDYQNETIHICNPIMREYVTLPKPKYTTRYPNTIVYGFGFSSFSGHYKVVQIHSKVLSDPALGSCRYETQGEVYVLGTGKWRSIGDVPFLYDCRLYSVSLHNNLHWLICDVESHELICSFDIDKEVFQSFPSPPQLTNGTFYKSLGLFGGRLCVCDNSSDSDLDIWVMKEYGVRESWSKDIVIKKSAAADLANCLSYACVTPIKVCRNGDILILWRDDYLYLYNPERKTLEEVEIPQDNNTQFSWPVFELMLYMASFCSLKDFERGKVNVF